MALYTFLNDSFDEADGGLIGYAKNNITQTAVANRHYNLRSFSSFNYTIARTMQDLSFWNVNHFAGETMASLQNPVSLTGAQAQANPISAIDGKLMSALDNTSMSVLDFFYITAGSEQWTAVSGTQFTLSKAGTRFSDLLDVTVSGSAAITSTYNDNIVTNFNIQGQPYYIEFMARGLVTTASGGQQGIDCGKSFIDFSSDASGNFDPSKTNSFSFDQSLLNMRIPDGDKTFRINRDSITKADLTNLRHIQFRLVTSGTGTPTHFKVQGLRMYPFQNYTFDVIDVDTKRQFLARALPLVGTAEPSSSSGIYFFGGTKPKNVNQTIRFNSGHSPTGNSNILTLYYRYTADAQGNNPNYVKLSISASGTGTTFAVSTATSGTLTPVATTNFGALTNETDYFLKVSLMDSTFRAAIYTVDSAFPGPVVFDQGNLAIPLTASRGQLGWDFNPFNYDFTVDYIRVGLAEFGELRTKASPSFTPVQGVLLKSVVTSPPIDLLAGQTYFAAQNATITTSTTFGTPPPSYFVQRGMSDWWGGIFTSNFITIGNTNQLYIQGDIYPIANYTGTFRIVLIDNYGSIGYLTTLPGLLGGQWNHFYFPIRNDIAPNAYQVGIVNDGFGGDSFYLDNLQLLHSTVGWAASINNGVSWQPFFDNINSDLNGVNFKAPDRNLKIRARTHSDSAWIANFGYEPIYAYPGLYQPNSLAIGLRITGV